MSYAPAERLDTLHAMSGEDQPAPASVPPASTGARDAAAFEHAILPHLDAAHNLAWWLLRNDDDAAEITQESCLKAWRAFPAFRGGDARVWLLAIVRNTAMSRLRATVRTIPVQDDDEPVALGPPADGALFTKLSRAEVEAALASIADQHREILVLREVEGLTYDQIALVIDRPTGTVMSRLSRARDAFARAVLDASRGKETP